MSLLLLLRPQTVTPPTPPSVVTAIVGARILGAAQKGATLTIDLSGLTGTFTYQWVRADPATPSTWTPIAGATGITYTLTAADTGKLVSAYLTS